MAVSRKISRRHCFGLLGAGGAAGAFSGCGSPPESSERDLVFPGNEWDEAEPATLEMDPAKLDAAFEFHGSSAGDAEWHAVVLRGGRLVADRHGNSRPDRRYPMASLCKSVYGSMLGIAIEEGRIGGLDECLVDAYPEIEGAAGKFGPYPDGGRFFSEDDREVTFRHLVTHTGGFMRENEPPGAAWTYDTFGMAAMMHAIAKQYGHYDSADPDPEARRGDGELIAQKLRDPIGASWLWKYTNFPNHPPEAKLNLFGNYVTLRMRGRQDLARLGLLWLANGRWKDRQVIPEVWHRESIRVAEVVKQCAPEEEWKYGRGFWVNEFGRLWPELPRDSYMAAGFPNHSLWICPSLSMVVAASPGLPKQEEFEDTVKDSRFLERVVDAVRS